METTLQYNQKTDYGNTSYSGGCKQEKQNPQNTVDVKDYILGTTNKQNKNLKYGNPLVCSN